MKKKQIINMIGICCVLLSGCGNSQQDVYLELEAETEVADTENIMMDSEANEICFVYVCGAVVVPGVYALPQSSRVYEAIAMAGGMTAEAGRDAVNQAELVTDGQMLRIPTQEELLADYSQSGSMDSTEKSDGRIDINVASQAELMTLPGIGQSKADGIIAYRQDKGGFSAIEEIMNVEGIKEGVYNRIKDNIKVK